MTLPQIGDVVLALSENNELQKVGRVVRRGSKYVTAENIDINDPFEFSVTLENAEYLGRSIWKSVQ